MAITITRNKLSLPITGKLQEKGFASYRQETKKYLPLLHSIAISLGLSEKESKELAECVCLIGEKNYAHQKENFSLKIWLSKILVHNCIFKISSDLFSQNSNNSNSFQPNINYLVASSVFKVPISFRTVYILFHSNGFTESEVAQILNITPMQVRERLAKAKAIINQRL